MHTPHTRIHHTHTYTQTLESTIQLLAVGTSKGVLSVYDTTSKEEDNLKLITSFVAHPPQPGPQNPRFGQLGLQYVTLYLKRSDQFVMCFEGVNFLTHYPTEQRFGVCAGVPMTAW